MKFVEFDFTTYNNRYKRYQNNLKELLQSIVDMHTHCIEIQDYTWATAKIGQNSLSQACKRWGFDNLNIRIRTIDDVERLFVINWFSLS
jgi:hypothetical protein